MYLSCRVNFHVKISHYVLMKGEIHVFLPPSKWK